jgi:glycosyltransferase involved in cell wall biosynthesis
LSRPLSVLHVAQPVDYGIAILTASLVADQVRRGWSVTVACPDGGYLAELARDAGAERIRWEATRGPGPKVAGETRRLARIVGDTRPDVLHLHSTKAGLAGRLAVRGRIPTVFQPNAWSFAAAEGPLRAAIVRWERFGARWCDALVAVSTVERQMGREEDIRARWAHVPNGIDLDRFAAAGDAERAAARRELGLEDGPLVVAPSRLFVQKGLDVLLRAWPAVLREVPDARLEVVGEGPERAALEAIGAQRVRLGGATDDVRPWLAAADVVALPSRWEGMSLSLLETMAAARSIVATEVSGTRDALGEGRGAIVPVEAEEPLAAAIVERLRDPALAAAEGRAARQRMEEAFDLRVTTQQMAELYAAILARRDGSVSSS